MDGETPGYGPRSPTPATLRALADVILAELETEFPGFVDRLIARLGKASLRAEVISLSQARADPRVIDAQHLALLWLTEIAPLVRAPAARSAPRAKRKRGR